MIDVVLADDQALIRSGLRLLLDSDPGIEVVGEAADGEEAVAVALATQPAVILMDINMPGVDGIEATRRIAADERLADVRVVILTSLETDERIFEALRAGASGFLLKDSDPAELVRGIKVVAEGEALLAPSVTRRLIADIASRPEASLEKPMRLEWLTDREREVMVLVALGLTNDEIAGRLVISTATAKTHVGRAMRKVGAHDRAQLVVLAYESALVVPGCVPTPAVRAELTR
jgi:DNA-binding NarL/FixJ family response regulator